MPDVTNSSIDKIIVFRFEGGVRDGQAIRSDHPQSAQEAQAFWQLTWKGTIGRRFDVPAPGGPAYQRYQVKSKYETGDEIHVTCEHVA